MRVLTRFSGALGLSAVAAGAYGAHGLEAHWQQDGLDLDDADRARWLKAYASGQSMHLFGAASTMALATRGAGVVRMPGVAAVLVGGGAGAFALSCYLGAYFADRQYTKLAPVAGSAMMLGLVVITVLG